MSSWSTDSTITVMENTNQSQQQFVEEPTKSHLSSIAAPPKNPWASRGNKLSPNKKKPEEQQSFAKKYETFLLRNAGKIASFDSTVRSFSYLITGQVHDVEIVTEGVFSTLQIVGLYHDRILNRALKDLVSSEPGYRPNSHNRYTEKWIKISKMYKRLVILLTLIRATELLWEMIGRKAGKRWKAVISIEAVKAVIRMGLMVCTKGRILLTPPTPESEVDPARIKCDEEGDISLLPQGQNQQQLTQLEELGIETPFNEQDETWTMPRTGTKIPKYPLHNISVDEFLAQRALRADDIRDPEQLLRQLNWKGLVGESLYILRPLLYACLAYKYRKDKRNWTPWIAGISLEYISRTLVMSSYKNIPGGQRLLEQEEHGKRATEMGWWALRGAMYENLTRPVIAGVMSKVSKIPLTGPLLNAVVEDYLYLFDQYHFPSSTL